MTPGRTTLVQLDLPDASNGPDASLHICKPPATPIHTRKKRALQVTPSARSRQIQIRNLPQSVPQWASGPIPFPIPEASQAREPEQPNSSIEAAFETKAKKFSQAGRALAELENLVAGKVREWEQAGLVKALELGTEIHNVIKKYCKGLNINNKNTIDSNITNRAKGNTPSWAQVAASSNSKEAPKGGFTKAHPTRIFIRLPPEHKARTANPYATLQKLRAEIPADVSKGIRSVQPVPSGLAVTLDVNASTIDNLDAKGKIANIFEGADVELEQKWVVFIILEAPRSFRDYDGNWQQITEQQAKEEFRLQTGIPLLKFYWAKSQE